MQPKESKSNRHFIISMVKSAVRVIAGTALFASLFSLAGILFIVAECLGVAEEI